MVRDLALAGLGRNRGARDEGFVAEIGCLAIRRDIDSRPKAYQIVYSVTATHLCEGEASLPGHNARSEISFREGGTKFDRERLLELGEV